MKDDEVHETYRNMNIGLEICVNMERLEGHILYVSQAVVEYQSGLD